jgi:hypothetical protein
MTIFAVGSGNGPNDARVASNLAEALRRAGFPVVNNRNDAALILGVAVQGADGPQQDLSSGFFAWTATARVSFKLAWAADDSVVLAGDVAKSGRAQDRTAVTAQALLADIADIVEQISRRAGR